MQVHAVGAVRHTEKRRRGTCEFANRVARIALKKYESTVPQSYRDLHKQTCVAAIVACFQYENTNETPSDSELLNYTKDHLQVIGIGVGTKFLSSSTIRDDPNNCTRIRDCHAEVLARRAFRRQLLHEIEADVCGKTTTCLPSDYISILERVKEPEQSTHYEAKRFKSSSNDSCDEAKGEIPKYRLKQGVTLHFYASSAPCGNATLKKFVKMEKEMFDSSMPPNQWPEQIHVPIAPHSLRLGQFALLVKKDSSLQAPSEHSNDSDARDGMKPYDSPVENISETPQQSKPTNILKSPKPKLWPYRQDDSWCPPSCSITNWNKGTIHSCSDKICRWNCLGLQGSLLMALLDEPVYMSTLTVGRKFSRAICQRAVCCRAEGFKTSIETKKYRLNHPVLMETNVYMDEAGTHKMEGTKTIGQDAVFDSNACWVWWPGHVSCFVYDAECIDGKTGYMIDHDHPSVTSKVSAVSDESYVSSLVKILDAVGSDTNSLSALGLQEIASLKKLVSPDYEAAKKDFLRHRVFREWSCRYKL